MANTDANKSISSVLSVVFENHSLFAKRLEVRDPALMEELETLLIISDKALGASAARCYEEKREQVLGKVMRAFSKSLDHETQGAIFRSMIIGVLNRS